MLGISSGAIIAARAALTDTRIERLILFEPPLGIDGSIRLDMLPDLDTAFDAGDLPRALGLGMKFSEMGPPWMFRRPVPLLAAASKRMLNSPDIQAKAKALRSDFTIVRENADTIADFGGISA